MPSIVPHSVTARYTVRRKDHFWLLERADTNKELALYDTQHQAVARAEGLAKETCPSVLEIVHTPNTVEKRQYPLHVSSAEPLSEATPETRV